MARTLLQTVNDVLKKVFVIQGDSGDLSTLSDSARQIYIDLAVSSINETIDDLYTASNEPMPNEVVEGTITLATSDRDYALPAALVQIRWPLIDQTNGQYIVEYPGGYEAMFADQAYPANYTGLPTSAAIRPSDGLLYMDRIPTSDENGNVYTYMYDKDVSLSVAADTVPFSDAVTRALIPAMAERWKRARNRGYSESTYNKAMGIAATLVRQKQQNSSYLRHSASPRFDFFDDG